MSPGIVAVWRGLIGRPSGRLVLVGLLLPLLQAMPAAAPASAPGVPQPRLVLEQGDTVAFVGGSDVAAAALNGHLEALLTAAFPGKAVRFRNLGWEGDTVFERPRDVGFPPLTVHLQRVGASVVVLQFGRTEALDGRKRLPQFVEAYRALATSCAKRAPPRRLVLVTPPPLETGQGMTPDLSRRNSDLGAYAAAIRELAQANRWLLVDLFAELGAEAHREPRLTEDGLQLTPRGQALVAAAFARQLGLIECARKPGDPSAEGVWAEPAFEQLRRAVVDKNRLWIAYWRPQNWAFLGGDRVTQPSSRDHRDPSVRWFPVEMEKFLPLIATQEERITTLVRGIVGH